MMTIKDLRARYKKALKDGDEEFTIEGYRLLTKYAKYVLEFLDSKNIPETTALRSIFVKAPYEESIAG